MAKGKQAAAAANRRLREAEERIAELEAIRDSETAEAHEREERLKAEVQNLKGRLLSEVESAASARVESVRRDYERQLAELTRAHREAIEEAFRYINDHGLIKLEIGDHAHVAKLLGMKPGEWLSLTSEAPRRKARRANRAHANAVAELDRQGMQL